jgi:hypothetical protein
MHDVGSARLRFPLRFRPELLQIQHGEFFEKGSSRRMIELARIVYALVDDSKM